MPHWGVAFEI